MDFKFDVPAHGAITFKIMFEPGVLPEEFPQARERKTRQPMPQGTEPQEVAPAADVAEAEMEPQPQDEQTTEALPTSTAEAFAQALEDTQAAGEPVIICGSLFLAGDVLERANPPAKDPNDRHAQ